MDKTPEVSSIEGSAEKETQGIVFDTIDRILVAGADEAEKKVSTNPNVTAFSGWENEAVPGARLDAMNNGMYSILKEILGESSDFDEDKVKKAAEDYVAKMVSRQQETNANELQFK